MAKGAWRLQLLSDRPLLPLSDSSSSNSLETKPTERKDSKAAAAKSSKGVPDEGTGEDGGGGITAVPCQERVGYGGVYVPNKYLLLFR